MTNAQVNNIVNALKAIGAWEINDLGGLISLSGTNAEVISTLASYFQQEFSQGAKISLDLLWAKLQQPPFGYYNSMTVGCFIGLVMRSLVNGSFNWFDGVNTLPPTAGNLASMVSKMLDGKTLIITSHLALLFGKNSSNIFKNYLAFQLRRLLAMQRHENLLSRQLLELAFRFGQ